MGAAPPLWVLAAAVGAAPLLWVLAAAALRARPGTGRPSERRLGLRAGTCLFHST